MKKLFLFFGLLLTSHSYSQELMNFYIEPAGDNTVSLHSLVYRNMITYLGGYTVTPFGNTVTVSFCYINTSQTSETFDLQTNSINLPIGYSTYTIIVNLYGDNDGAPCTSENLADTGTITFEYPLNQNATTFIPENAFEAYVEDFGFGDDIPNNDLVFTHRIVNMTHLFLDHTVPQLQNMEGLQDFIALKRLRCNDNLITELDFSNNLNLEWLWCGQNPINQLNLTNSENLIWLDGDEMNLTSLDLTNNIELEYLRIGQNNLNYLDISQNTNLVTLFAHSNQLENIDVSNNIFLEYLGCGINLLSSLDVSNNNNLKQLDFVNNSILEIDLSNNNLIEYLGCGGNLLSELSLTNLTSLTNFYAYGNQLIALDLSNNALLEEVSVKNNNLTSLNLKNGNNANIEFLVTIDNEDLYCIDVDDPSQAPYSGWNVDSQVVFSEDCSLGIEGFLENKISFYPNPVKELLIIENNTGDAIITLQVYDVLGRELLTSKGDIKQLDVSTLSSGLLFVQVRTDKGSLVNKVVKK